MSFLGSILTTYVREPEIQSLDELKKLNIKTMASDPAFRNFSGFEDIKNIIIEEENGTFFENIVSLNRSFTYIVSSSYWELSNMSNSFYILKDFNFETTYLRHVLPFYSIFKRRFNRYIEIVKDSGLYNFWKSNSIFEMSDLEKQRNF